MRTTLLATLAVSLAVQAWPSAAPAQTKRPWTVMYYSVTDKRIADQELRDLNSVPRAIRRPEAVACTLQYDAEGTASKRYVADSGTWREQAGAVSDNLGDPVTFYRFLEWSMTTCPAEKYFLFISSHGSGWEDKRGPGSTADRARPTSWVRERLQESLTTTTKRSSTARDADGKGTAYDYDDNDCLTLQEIRVVLEEIQKRFLDGRKLDAVAHWSCWQLNMEQVLEHQDVARFIVGCETTSVGGAMSTVAEEISRNPAVETKAICDKLIKNYIDRAPADSSVAWFDTDGIQQVVAPLDTLSAELLRVQRHPKTHGVAGSAFSDVVFTDSEHHKGDERFLDLGSLLRAIKRGSTGFKATPLMAQAAEQLTAALSANMKTWRTEPYSSRDSKGISIYLPVKGANFTTMEPFLRELREASETHWDEYLSCLKGAGYSHAKALAGDLAALAERARALEDPALAPRARQHLTFLQDQAIQLLAEQLRLEVEEEDGACLAEFAAATEALAGADRPVVGKLLARVLTTMEQAVLALSERRPELAKHVARARAALAAAVTVPGVPDRLPGE